MTTEHSDVADGRVDVGREEPEGQVEPLARSRREFLTLTAGSALALGAASAQQASNSPIAGEEATLGWDSTVAGNFLTIINRSGGGYALAGGTASDPTQSNCKLVTLTDSGDVDRRMEYDLDGALYPLLGLPDGYVGVHLTVVQNTTNVRLLRLDSDGSIRETGPQLGGRESDQFYDMIQTADGGIVLCGWTYSRTDSSGHDLWLVKATAEGQLEWSRTFGTDQSFYANGLLQTDDGGFLLVGGRWYQNAPRDGLVLKTDRQGREEWRRTLGGDGTDSLISVAPLGDDFVVGGRTAVADNVSRGIVYRLDPDGKTVWSRTISEGAASRIRALRVVGTSGIVAAGRIMSGDGASAQLTGGGTPVGGGVPSGGGGSITTAARAPKQVAEEPAQEALFVELDADGAVTSTASTANGVGIREIVLSGAGTAAFVGVPPTGAGSQSWAGTVEHDLTRDDDGETENSTETEPDDEDGESPDGDGPGFGVLTGLGGLGGAGYLLSRRLGSDGERRE